MGARVELQAGLICESDEEEQLEYTFFGNIRWWLQGHGARRGSIHRPPGMCKDSSCRTMHGTHEEETGLCGPGMKPRQKRRQLGSFRHCLLGSVLLGDDMSSPLPELRGFVGEMTRHNLNCFA